MLINIIEMGLDLMCNEVSQRCGSYKLYENMKYELLMAVLKYVKANLSSDVDLISYLEEITLNEVVNYDKFDKCKSFGLILNSLDGFNSIIIEGNPHCIDSFQAENFLKTFELVKNYVDDIYKNDDNNFFLYEVFNESKETGEEIYFG